MVNDVHHELTCTREKNKHAAIQFANFTPTSITSTAYEAIQQIITQKTFVSTTSVHSLFAYLSVLFAYMQLGEVNGTNEKYAWVMVKNRIKGLGKVTLMLPLQRRTWLKRKVIP